MISENSYYPAKRRRNESILKSYVNTLIDMKNDGYSLTVMQDYLAKHGIEVNTTTIWRYINKQITRQVNQTNSIKRINACPSKIDMVKPAEAFKGQVNTDKSMQKSILEKLDDLDSIDDDF